MSTIPQARPNVRAMSPYVPGEQPKPGEKVIKLNTNENPYPPSPKVLEAIRSIDGDLLRRYPSPRADRFRETAARVHEVSPDMVLAGNGSDEILAIVLRTFVGRGEILAYPDPTYSLYPVLSDIGEITVRPIPWEGDWELPVRGLLDTGAKAIFFANPNAPSGTVVKNATIARLAEQFSGLILVDEAYVDFADESALPLLKEYPNVILSRTFSKGYSLASLRFGYALACPAIIAEMMKVKDSYNCDGIAIAAATAALADQPYAARTWSAVRKERDRMTLELSRLGYAVIPSHSNFLLATCPSGAAAAIYQALKANGILVRYFDNPGLRDKLRITIGTREENNTLLNQLSSLT